MRNDFEDGINEEHEDLDDLGFSKAKKSAVLEVEENGEVIIADDSNFESDDMETEEDNDLERGFALYEQREDDDLSLQF